MLVTSAVGFEDIRYISVLVLICVDRSLMRLRCRAFALPGILGSLRAQADRGGPLGWGFCERRVGGFIWAEGQYSVQAYSTRYRAEGGPERQWGRRGRSSLNARELGCVQIVFTNEPGSVPCVKPSPAKPQPSSIKLVQLEVLRVLAVGYGVERLQLPH